MVARGAQKPAPEICKLSVNMDRGLRERIRATSSLLGLDIEEFVADVLRKEVDRLGLINEKALAATA